ncbi:uncharacterized protein LOC125500393 [Athalia rosae]|uniref:uncharacterized protein LOC125500393 n=1 Tax=Athalia rosae TaxID=37344 RepID=UPI0020335BA3|nr:uncharacterized protein LOC125500393 [Athalia rosae]
MFKKLFTVVTMSEEYLETNLQKIFGHNAFNSEMRRRAAEAVSERNIRDDAQQSDDERPLLATNLKVRPLTELLEKSPMVFEQPISEKPEEPETSSDSVPVIEISSDSEESDDEKQSANPMVKTRCMTESLETQPKLQPFKYQFKTASEIAQNFIAATPSESSHKDGPNEQTLDETSATTSEGKKTDSGEQTFFANEQCEIDDEATTIHASETCSLSDYGETCSSSDNGKTFGYTVYGESCSSTDGQDDLSSTASNIENDEGYCKRESLIKELVKELQPVPDSSSRVNGDSSFKNGRYARTSAKRRQRAKRLSSRSSEARQSTPLHCVGEKQKSKAEIAAKLLIRTELRPFCYREFDRETYLKVSQWIRHDIRKYDCYSRRQIARIVAAYLDDMIPH